MVAKIAIATMVNFIVQSRCWIGYVERGGNEVDVSKMMESKNETDAD